MDKKRYALSVAKSAHSQMVAEKKQKILAIAQDFDWDIGEGAFGKDFCVGFSFYLKNAAHMHGSEWKLVNQIMDKGKVYLNNDKVVRLLQEEVKNRVDKKLDVSEIRNLPSEITVIAEGLIKSAQEIMGQEIENIPKEVVKSAFPPCIDAIYQAASKTHHLSQMERFTLTSFLLNIGMSTEKVSEIYKSFSDYNERLTSTRLSILPAKEGLEHATFLPNAPFCRHMACAKTGMICAGASITR